MARPRPVLSEMPYHVHDKLSEKLDFETRMRLGSCSKYFKDVTQKTECSWKNVKISDIGFCSLEFENEWTTFSASYMGSSGRLLCKRYAAKYKVYASDEQEENEKQVEGRTDIIQTRPLYVLLDDLKFMLNYGPRVSIKKFTISDKSLDIAFYNHLKAVLSSLKHKIAVQELSMSGRLSNTIMRVLPFLEPGTLKSINFSSRFEECVTSHEQGTEQWKRAVSISVTGPRLDFEVVRKYINDALDRREPFKCVSIRSTNCVREHIILWLRKRFDCLPGKPDVFYKKHSYMDCFIQFSVFFDNSSVKKDSVFQIIRVFPVTYEPMD